MPFWQFLRLDAAGALLYSLTYVAVGFVSRDFLAAILRAFMPRGGRWRRLSLLRWSSTQFTG